MRWDSLGDRSDNDDHIPLAVAGVTVMTHVSVAANRPKCGHTQLGFVERNPNSIPGSVVGRVIGEGQRATGWTCVERWP